MPIKQPNMSELSPSEWFVPLQADTVSMHGRQMHLAATEKQMKDIADRLGVKAIDNLQADEE